MLSWNSSIGYCSYRLRPYNIKLYGKSEVTSEPSRISKKQGADARENHNTRMAINDCKMWQSSSTVTYEGYFHDKIDNDIVMTWGWRDL
jgi:hypothetical protein